MSTIWKRVLDLKVISPEHRGIFILFYRCKIDLFQFYVSDIISSIINRHIFTFSTQWMTLRFAPLFNVKKGVKAVHFHIIWPGSALLKMNLVELGTAIWFEHFVKVFVALFSLSQGAGSAWHSSPRVDWLKCFYTLYYWWWKG